MSPNEAPIKGYAPVNGLKMYYEIEGAGEPLVFIPPAFGVAGTRSFPALAKSHRLVTMDLQGHGRTADIPERPLSIEQHAKDVVGLMNHLGIAKADLFGESYGGAVAALIALHHPGLVRRVATYGATFGPPEAAVDFEMLGTSSPPAAESSGFQFQRESYKKVAPDPDYWPSFWQKGCNLRWNGFSRKELGCLQAPVLIALGDHDFVRVDHALDTFKILPNAELAVIPDAGHFALFSEPHRVIPVIEHFLNKPERRIPIATAEMGYHPGETR